MTDTVVIPTSGLWTDIAEALNHNTSEVNSDLADKMDKTGITLNSEVAATTGNVTINKPMGRCKLAAGVTSIVVTNSLVTANSNIFCTVMKLDAATIKNVVATTGAFTIYFGAGATGPAVEVAFMVANPAA
mgnify:FL=1|tara:strand:+ start:24 stop:416 length:393 start_codon:yes stop_codon:yes gene_type:complete